MTLPARRQHAGGMAERGLPGWARDPLAEFDDLFQQIGTLLESAVGGRVPAGPRAAWVPLADVTETDDAYLVEAELPGVKREDVDVEISNQNLIISGELKEQERPGAHRRRGTRRTGRFEFRALLPSEVNAEEVGATMRDGVLTVTVPKAQPAKPRHIKITTGR